MLPIRRASHTRWPTVQDVGVDHRRGDVAVPEQFLHCADVVSVLEQVRGERVPEAMARRRLRDARATDRVLHGSLKHGLVQVVASALA